MFREDKGYTLIELMVVIILAGLLMTFTIPRFQESFLTDNLKTSTRRIISLIYSARDDAIRENNNYTLKFDKVSGRYWVESSDMPETEKSIDGENADTLPDDVRIREVMIVGGDNGLPGEPGICFNKKGYAQPAIISLGSDKGRDLTLIIRPFLRKIEVVEGQVDPAEVRF